MIDLHRPGRPATAEHPDAAPATAEATGVAMTGEEAGCCYHADASYVDARTGEFQLIKVIRDRPGCQVVATYAGLAEATGQADELNRQCGVDAMTKRDIICSSRTAAAANRQSRARQSGSSVQ